MLHGTRSWNICGGTFLGAHRDRIQAWQQNQQEGQLRWAAQLMTYLVEPSVDQSIFHCPNPPQDLGTLAPSAQLGWTALSASPQGTCFEAAGIPFWNQSIVVNESSRSQFDALEDLARAESPPTGSIACLALSGKGFHGNRGREWCALPGNLHFSSFCRLDLNASRCGPALSMLPTVAVVDVIRLLLGENAPARCWIKWVNDVFIHDAKVSGSLVSTQLEGDRISSCVLGIGLNVRRAPPLANDSVSGAATSLLACGVHPPLKTVFELLLEALAARLAQLGTHGGPKALYGEYRKRLGGIGRRVEIMPESGAPRPLAAGRLLDVREDLSLKLEGEQEVRFGRLRFADSGVAL
jgi:BirA family biotin operon repressor/biotin-[acetyl-CoA-carboxylase] ligase